MLLQTIRPVEHAASLRGINPFTSAVLGSYAASLLLLPSLVLEMYQYLIHINEPGHGLHTNITKRHWWSTLYIGYCSRISHI